MKKILLSTFLLFSILTSLPAQHDTIALKIGVKMPVKLVKVWDTIFYRSLGSDSSKIRRFVQLDVDYIRYADGRFVSYRPKIQAEDRQILLKGGHNFSQLNTPFQFTDLIGGNQFSIAYISKKKGKGKHVRVEGELGYKQRGGWVISNNVPEYLSSGGYYGTYAAQYLFRLNYLYGSCQVRYYIHNIFYIKGGLEAGYLQSYESHTVFESYLNSNLYSVSSFKRISSGLNYGFGVQSDSKRVGFLMELVFHNDVTSIGLQSPDGKVYHNNSGGINVGIYINLAKRS
jgi:hypothetical protein